VIHIRREKGRRRGQGKTPEKDTRLTMGGSKESVAGSDG
jgi:hypothetical protein